MLQRLIYLAFIFSISATYACKPKGKQAPLTQTEKGSIQIDESILDFAIEGNGRDCLVIGSSVYYPRTFSAELRKHLRMHFVDLKWFAKGYQKEELSEVDIASILEDVEQIRKELSLEKVLIMGHSIHGTIATEYVKAYPDAVSGLVVIGSPSQWGNEAYDQKAAELWASASEERKQIQEKNWGKSQEIDRLTGQEEASARYNNMSPQYWYNPTYDASWLWEGMTVHSELTQHLFTQVFKDYDMFDPPVPISVPVFIALGKYDYVIPHTLWKDEYESIGDLRLIRFDTCGHTPQLEVQQAFDRELIAWLGDRYL
ncbi:MAG: alpha/beta hydrolase [Bacteroidia bacterium]|nr:alpha/beta hydrolase [Bacteroidia bacterium]